MSGYGAGQGFSQGVQMAGSYLMPALQMRMQQKRYDEDRALDKERYDQQNQRYDKRMSQMDKQFYDRLALDQAWKDGFYGGPSTFNGGDAPASQIASGQPAPASTRGPVPYQVTRDKSPAELLAGQYTSPWMPDPSTPRTYADPVNPSPSRMSPSQSTTYTQPSSMPSYRGPSPSATPFSSASSNPHMEQRTFQAPKDPSMVMKRLMPEPRYSSPGMPMDEPPRRIPPQSMMRPRSFRSGY